MKPLVQYFSKKLASTVSASSCAIRCTSLETTTATLQTRQIASYASISFASQLIRSHSKPSLNRSLVCSPFTQHKESPQFVRHFRPEDFDEEVEVKPPKEARPFTDEENERKKVIASRLRNFVKKVHPDLFVSIHPGYKEVNEKSLQLLNNLFASVENYILKQEVEHLLELPTPIKLHFVYKGPKDYHVFKVTFHLPFDVFTAKYDEAVPRVWRFYEQCVDHLEKEFSKEISRHKKR